MPYLLSVDLGTTFTAAATAAGGEPTMVGLGNRALQVPSVLFLADDGFVVGEAAERRGLTEPARIVREFKRRLGDHVPVLVNGSPFSADALMARMLQWVVAQVSERMGEPPAEVVLTHPASWGPFKLEALNQVATLADVGTTRWCAEPVAAAAQYAARAKIQTGDRLAVYDLGGGTLDICVLEKTDTGFVMLGPPEGVEQLGGADFDEALFQLVLRSLGDQLDAADPDDPQTTNGLARLRRDCVEAKEALSSEVEVAVPVSLPGVATSVRVTRSEFEGLIRPTLQQTVNAVNRALRAATITPADLAGIVLVGGSSRIPLVGEILQRDFGVAVAMDTHPKHDIALGAVRLIQDLRATPGAQAVGVSSRPVPMPITRPAPRPASPEPAAPAGPTPTAGPTTPTAAPPTGAPPVSAAAATTLPSAPFAQSRPMAGQAAPPTQQWTPAPEPVRGPPPPAYTSHPPPGYVSNQPPPNQPPPNLLPTAGATAAGASGAAGAAVPATRAIRRPRARC